ncbi:BNR repeat-containing protein, partial [Rhodopirellula maiorica SM1]
DLLPFAFSGWDDAIVISSNPGDRTDDPITVADTVYFDFGWVNLGDASTGGSYAVEARLDGSIIAFNGDIPDTASFSGFSFSDIDEGPLSVGLHTVSFEVDVDGDIAEDNETNNVYSRQFTVMEVGTEDFGDAPTAAQSGLASSYPTLLADNGARHTPVSGFQLGDSIDVEADGQPSVGASDDDTFNTDDEDGVEFTSAISIGGVATADVLVTNTAGVTNPYLDAWIDFNQDGDWDDSGELVFSGAVVAGTNSINVTVPGTTLPGVTYARFRLHDGTSGLTPTGLASSGEVEDYLVQTSTPGQWSDQGPSPTINGQLELGTQPNRQVTGAIHTVLAHPTDPDIVYIGSVNGGIWRTNNFTAADPTWVPQTDFLESLGIGAMAFDPTDPTFNTIVAGTAKYSSFAGLGGVRGPVYRTTDGGANWIQLASDGLRTVGENISGIAARGNTIVVSSSVNFGGIFRSTDGGATFHPITDADFVSPNDNFTDLVEDPTNINRLYTVSEGIGGSAGIYRSDNFGVNWTKIAGDGSAAIDTLLQQSNNVEMAVSPQTGRLFAAVLISAQPQGVFYSDNTTAGTPTWTQMDVPVLPLGGTAAITGATNATPIVITSANHGLVSGSYVVIDGVAGNTAANGFYRVTRLTDNTFSLDNSSGNGDYVSGGTWSEVTGPNPRPKDIEETGAQGRIHFSIVVDPTDPDIVYIGGDRQEQPNVIGDNTYGGAIFRGDASIARNPRVAPSPQWDHATHDFVPGVDPDGGTASGTAPHADSREMVFDANGNLVEVDDGGIYMRTSPRDRFGDWFSKAGTLGVVEFHDVGY